MAGTNFISGIVKILENPKQTLINKTTTITEFRGEFPQAKNNQIVDLVFWGDLATSVLNYYNLSDYIIIEGYLSLQESDSLNSGASKSERVKITVLKVYPFLLSSQNFIGKE